MQNKVLTFGLGQGFLTFILSFTPWQISKVKFTPKYFFMLSLLQISIVIGKNLNFLLTKFTPKAGQIYPQLRTPGLGPKGMPHLYFGISIFICCLHL